MLHNMISKLLLFVFFGLLLISNINAKEFEMTVGDTITFEGKQIRLDNTGGGSALLNIDGTPNFISDQEIVDNLEINVVYVYHGDTKAEGRATLDIYIADQICHVDAFCEFKNIMDYGFYHGDVKTFRGKEIRIVGHNEYYTELRLEVDGVTEIIKDEDFVIINDIGFEFIKKHDLLLVGENYDNCPSDCSLNEGHDALVEKFCSNNEKDEETKEEGIDCGGWCEFNCVGGVKPECEENWDCMSKFNETNKLLYFNFCQNGKCVNRESCKEDSDCVVVVNDCCKQEHISINGIYREWWQNELDKRCSSKSCLKEPLVNTKVPVCENEICKLVEQGCQDLDKDGYFGSPCLEDCDDNNPKVNAYASEICDGKDNNCNEKIDERCEEDKNVQTEKKTEGIEEKLEEPEYKGIFYRIFRWIADLFS